MQSNIFIGDNTNPYYNLAFEEQLFETAHKIIFFLWQNENTVVIGRNQNPWKECRVSLTEQEGAKIARRSSGGGAVYHDLGNINFTFIMPRSLYDIKKQLLVIKTAMLQLGLETEFTGRNDIVIANTGEKFSGNAFRVTENTALHHGTVLVNVDKEKLGRYLVPSIEKLASKGVESVVARVANVSEYVENCDVKRVKDALVNSFISVYGPANLGNKNEIDSDALEEKIKKYSSWEWRMGKSPKFDVCLERRFSWGSLELQLTLKQGEIIAAEVYSDAMDETLPGVFKAVLLGKPFRSEALGSALYSLDLTTGKEVADWLMELGI